ncbi:MAG TPA: hypothetical protein VNO81_00500 [Candidatus Nitrosotenuis sp.]|nr:hypothetical protein [Candidatus Nitrosotenuis sp.]
MTDEEKEKVFLELVKFSWDRHNEVFHNQKLDDVLVGAVVAANVQDGHLLIDMNSDGVSHYLRFENPQDKSRLVFRLTHLGEDLATARVMGHLADVVIGYGEKTANVQGLFSAFKSEFKSAFVSAAEPGVVTFDADLTGGYIYAQIPLILDIDHYVDKSFKVNLELLNRHIESVVHSLRKYLRGRLAVKA